ncbi:MAG: hypothetical protein ABSE73_08715 [Planctomycetota bacterium]
MNNEDLTLQELIVRALTGRDNEARRSLETAAASDPELRRFYSELEDIVSVLSGSPDWRAAKPSPELTAKIRQAVVAKLPAAPPHFRTVLLESDLGRSRATRRLLLCLALPVLLAAAALYLWRRPGAEGERLKLAGKSVFEAPLQGQPLSGWEFVRGAAWQTGPDGLHSSGVDDSDAAYLKDGFSAGSALACNVDVRVPGLDEQSSVTIFLADAQGAAHPLFDAWLHPAAALELEITADGLVLNGPGNGPEKTLLQSQPAVNAAGTFLRLRLEHLGRQACVVVNGKVLFEGALPRPLLGPLHPGIRVAGPKKNEILFNALRIER